MKNNTEYGKTISYCSIEKKNSISLSLHDEKIAYCSLNKSQIEDIFIKCLLRMFNA